MTTLSQSQLLDKIASLLSRVDRGKKCIGFEQISVTDGSVATLTKAPSSAFSAFITVEESSSGAGTGKVIRFTQDGTTPTATVGVPLGDLDIYEVTNLDNIKTFKMIGIEAGKTHVINVEYFAQS